MKLDIWSKVEEIQGFMPSNRLPNSMGVLISPRKRTAEESKQIFEKRREKAVRGVEITDGVKVRYISQEDLEDLKRAP